jgi:hypothetical protein
VARVLKSVLLIVAIGAAALAVALTRIGMRLD